jgi:sugar/nucleoside kinase (ribokinase family)
MPRPEHTDRPVDVVTVGHAIVDVLAVCEDDLVRRFGLDKGTMTLVDPDRSEEVYAALGPTTAASGGSAANTAAGLASLGARVAFVGKVRDDELGKVFAHDIRATGVEFDVPAGTTGPGTGRCMIMVTADAEKTMCTNLGIGDLLAPEDIDEALIARSRALYLEGYLCGLESTDATVERAVAAAEAAGTIVSLSLSDPLWVELHGPALAALLPRVDVLFANEQEACGLVGTDDVEAAARELGRQVDTVAVTLGAEGSLVVDDGRVTRVAAEPVGDRVVDTTGAGDMYAAGFLHGWVRGGDPAYCARLGGLVASHIVCHLGARPLQPLAGMVEAARTPR